MRRCIPVLTVLLFAVFTETGAPLDPLDSGDACKDSDYDGLSNLMEFRYGADPFNPDTDGGGTPDGWDAYYDTHPAVFPQNSSWAVYDNDGDFMRESAVPPGCWFDPANGADEQADADSDDLCNLGEYIWGTDPTNPDSDGDGITDLLDEPEMIGCGTQPLETPQEVSGAGSQGAGMAPAFSVSWDWLIARTF
jgi:hypothetical protein